MIKNTRKYAVSQRLKRRIQAKSESLADQFEFRVYIAVIFKDSSKAAVLYRASQVISLMTSNYETHISKTLSESTNSMKCVKDLMQEDFAQLHLQKYCHLANKRFATEEKINFLIWPRNDIDKVTCFVFSRWKGEEVPFKHLQDFTFSASEYRPQIVKLLESNCSEFVINDCQHRMFMLIRNHPSCGSRSLHCSLSGICLFLPQEKLLCWDTTTEDDVLQTFTLK